jgi:hypothetical protein
LFCPNKKVKKKKWGVDPEKARHVWSAFSP